jgi:hypothetical protein
MRAALDAFVGDATDLHAELAKLVSRTFPGDEEKHEQWLRDATGVRVPKHTLPPPHSVPMASSSLLEDVASDPEIKAQPPASPRTSRPSIKTPVAKDAEAYSKMAADPNEQKRLWASVAVAIGLLLFLYFVLAR